MQKPNDPDLSLAVAALDIASRTWAHGADATLSMVEVLQSHGVPIAAFENRWEVSHPLISNGSVLWSQSKGGAWLIEVGGERIVESRAQRETAANPLYANQRRTRTSPELVGLLPESIAAYARDMHQVFREPLRVTLEGFTDACICTLDFGAAVRAILVCATHAPGGSSNSHLRQVHTAVWGLPATARSMRWRSLSHVIARSSIGPQTVLRVLEGRPKRGDLERRQAVIWFSEPRTFTAMSSALEPETVVARLNEVFDHIGKAIAREDGEILKFVGDGALAIFPYDTDASDACRRALRVARDCLGRLPPDLTVGIGLLRGQAAIGNIGASDRLDFTVIGATWRPRNRTPSPASAAADAKITWDPMAACPCGRCSSSRRGCWSARHASWGLAA